MCDWKKWYWPQNQIYDRNDYLSLGPFCCAAGWRDQLLASWQPSGAPMSQPDDETWPFCSETTPEILKEIKIVEFTLIIFRRFDVEFRWRALPEFLTPEVPSAPPVSPAGRCQDISSLSKLSPALRFAAGWSWSSSSCGSVLPRIYPPSVQNL